MLLFCIKCQYKEIKALFSYFFKTVYLFKAMTLNKWDYAFLIIMFLSLMIIGPANILNKQVNHPTPYGYLAGDNFWFQIYADVLDMRGKFDIFPAFMSAGFTDVIAFQPPLLYHMTSLFKTVSNVEIYDGIYWITLMFGVLACLMFYLLMREYSQTTAMFGSLLFLWMFNGTFNIKFSWGQWPFVLGSALLVFFFYCFYLCEKHDLWLLLSASLVGTAMAHTSEYIFAIGFMGLIGILKCIKLRNIDWKYLITCIKSIGLSIIITLPFLIIFRSSRLSGFSFKIVTPEMFGGLKVAFLSDFGMMQWVILFGSLLTIVLMFRKQFIHYLSSIYMFVIGYGYYFGLDKRAYETRSFWPVYLAVPVGVLLSLIFSKIVKKSMHIFIIAILAFTALAYVNYQPLNTQGIANSYVWDSFMWIRNNTPENATVAYLYGDLFNQGQMLANTHRMTFQTDIQGLADNAGKQFPFLTQTRMMYEGAGQLSYWKGFASIGHHTEDVEETYFERPMDMCMMDYLAFAKQGQYQQLVQLNQNVAQFFANKGAEVVFDNDYLIILHNKDTRGCI